MTKGEEEFINQMTRKKMVEWCDSALSRDDRTIPREASDTVYLDHAVKKGWLSAAIAPSARDMPMRHRILSTRWDTAARFLKR